MVLILSDPSGEYSKRFIDVPDNIFIINGPHPFVEVLKYVDCYIDIHLRMGIVYLFMKL